MCAISIVVANHHPVVRSNLRALLQQQPGLRVVGEAANGREAIVLTEYKRPKIVLLEVELPLLSGIEVARTLRSSDSAPAIVFYATHTDESYLRAAFDAGAAGYVGADCEEMEVIQAIRTVASGRRYLSPTISRRLLDANWCEDTLSERDRALCCHFAAGASYADLNVGLSLLERLRHICVPDVILKTVAQNARRAAE
jgi:two-component system, NarL family, response regulator NreC